MKQFLVQISLLLLAYYFVPGIILDFLKDSNPHVTSYSIMFIKIALVVLIIYSLFNNSVKLEKSFEGFLKTQLKLQNQAGLLGKFSYLLVQLVFILLIITITIPLLKYFLSMKVITVIKLGVLAYCLFLGWGIYKLFDVEEKPIETNENEKA